MPDHRLTPTSLLCLLPMWSVLMPAMCHPQHSPCLLVQQTALCNNAKLSSVPVDLPDNIEELQLNYNHIQKLTNNSLLRYPSLRSLSLAGNCLETFESNTFQHSEQLESLNLAENSLHVGFEETGHVLLKLPRLRILDLSDNGLEDNMASVLLQNLTSLEYLNLSRNLLLRLDESSFQDLHQLKELDLQRNNLFEIDGAFNGGTPKLQRLNLAFNYLPCLVEFQMTHLVVLNASHNSIEWFIANQSVLDTFHLETLDLTDNKLFFFPFLPNRSHLRNLYLSRNRMSFYEHLADDDASPNRTDSVQFYNLQGNVTNVTAPLWDEDLHGDISSLELLDLSGNLVTYFPEGFIRKMPALSRLRMSTNCLEALNLTLEQFPSSLYELDISNNRLTEIIADQGALKVLGSLTYLNLSLNNLQWLPSKLFSSLPNLRSADLSYNMIDICPEVAEDSRGHISECVVWRNMASLRQLYLKGCNLGRVPSSAFTGMSLTHLELSDNLGLIVGPGSVQSLSRTLQHLGLGNTRLHDLDFLTLFHRLKSLNISKNSLTHLPHSLLSLDLRTLDLRDNDLCTIPSGYVNMLAPRLVTVFLSGNPFNCCQLEWYRTFERTDTVNMVGRSDILCQDDDTKRRHQVEFFHSPLCTDTEGESIFWYVLLVLPIVLCFLGISVIFLLTFRPKLLPRAIKKKCWKPTPY